MVKFDVSWFVYHVLCRKNEQRTRGAEKKDIAAGIHKSIARRVGGMDKRIGVAPLLVFCGGVARNVAVKEYLEAELGFEAVVPQLNGENAAQFTGAIGAALIAYDKKD